MFQVTEIVETEEVVDVCAWCRCQYDRESRKIIRHLSDAEYEAVRTHGICDNCRQGAINEYKADRG